MIVVIGAVVGRRRDPEGTEAAGVAAALAMAAAAAGAKVEIVTRVGDDDAGDAVVLALAQAGVGHVATIRDAGRHTPVRGEPGDDADPAADEGSAAQGPSGPDEAPVLDAADVGLALRYLTDYRVIVLVDPADSEMLQEAAAAAGWASASMVVVTPPDGEAPADLPAGAIVVTAADDAEEVAGLLGRYAAAVDGGEDQESAYAVLTAPPSA